MSLAKGLYRHQISGKLFNVIGVGRRVEEPHKQVIIYKPFHDTQQYDTDVPQSDIWVKDMDTDLQHFTKLNQKIHT